jgi:hypothetical protein
MVSRFLLGAPVALVLALAACSGAPAGATPTRAPTGAPANATPTAAPGDTSGGGGTVDPAASRACQLLTVDELKTALADQTMAVTEAEANTCTWASAQVLPTLVLRVDSGETLEAARAILTDHQDITVGGHPAVIGGSGSLLYIDMGGGHVLVLQGVWGLQADTANATITSLGEKAAARF